MLRRIVRVVSIPFRTHVVGSLFIVLFVTAVMVGQVRDRGRFASGELYDDVMDRWGAPIIQPAPSVRFVETGAVFSRLEPLALASQEVRVGATMSYRKRGLVYFSGFDFELEGRYQIVNNQGFPIDLVFVFPIQISQNKVLLSGLSFSIDGEPSAVDLAERGDRLIWTGHLEVDAEMEVEIAFRGRGLDSFVYLLDPGLPVNDFRLEVDVSGGEGYDYPPGVVPATTVGRQPDAVQLGWSFESLQSGVPVGVILPHELGFDDVITTMLRRATVPGVLFFFGVAAIGLHRGRPLSKLRAYLVAATYAFFYVLLPYLAAFMSFYLAYIIALGVVGALIVFYLERAIGAGAGRLGLGLVASMLFVPTLAVTLEGYTGLVYTLEILVGLALLLFLSTQAVFDRLTDAFRSPVVSDTGEHHAT